MRTRRYARVLVLSIGLVTVLYVFLSAGYRSGRRKKERQVIVFNEDVYVNGEVFSGNVFDRHAFNSVASNQLRSDRVIPDSRNPLCKEKMYDTTGVRVSVIIAFHNEARSALLRTIMSVLNRTPEDLLMEIILVDDFSENNDDGQQLTVLPKVALIRNSKREGLSRSRAAGLTFSQGDHAVFLDSHCEVNVGWLEPLVEKVLKNPKSVASPVIDIVDHTTFQYQPSAGRVKGGFDWSLRFKWISEKPTVADPTESFKSPIIPGGLFLVQKQWFEQLGGFDEGLEIWGAEQFEISFKIWLCGGQVDVVPCSRVGHIFRTKHPYTFPNGSGITYLHNSRRIADIWMDEYKMYFYDTKPEARQVSIGNIQDRIMLKEKLNCRSFRWFLDNVYPELRFPRGDAIAFGQMIQGNLCTDSSGSKVTLSPCKQGHLSQKWAYTKDRELHTQNQCLAVNIKKDPVIEIAKCNKKPEQKWIRRRRTLIHEMSKLCLESLMNTQDVIVSKCQDHSYSQQWDFSMELQKWDGR